jgi:hypothetical protein
MYFIFLMYFNISNIFLLNLFYFSIYNLSEKRNFLDGMLKYYLFVHSYNNNETTVNLNHSRGVFLHYIYFFNLTLKFTSDIDNKISILYFYPLNFVIGFFKVIV